MSTKHTFPAIHNAMWPGLVGKGADSEPPIDLDTMLDLTAAAEVEGVRFDDVDLFLYAPHVEIDSSDRELEDLAERIAARGLRVGSGRAGLATHWRRLRNGERIITRPLSRASEEGLPDCE
jgi:hypothetical protein